MHTAEIWILQHRAYITPQLGYFRTKQLMLTGQKISAEEAFKDGWVSNLADGEGELDKLTQKYIEELKENGPGAMKRVKELVDDVGFTSHTNNLKVVAKVFGETIQSDEAMYGMSQFMQKKKPDWNAFIESKL